MKDRCIYKVDGGKGLYRVCEHVARGGYIMFAVKKGRRLAFPVSMFAMAKSAINAANNAAYKDCKSTNKLLYVI